MCTIDACREQKGESRNSALLEKVECAIAATHPVSVECREQPELAVT